MSRIRRWLIAGCLVAVVPLAWRAGGVATELLREREAATAYRWGTVLVNGQRFEEATFAFRRAITLSPRAPEPYRSLAEAEFKRGRIDEAVAAYRQLIAIYPYTYYSTLYWEVAIVEISAGRMQEARHDLLQAVAVDPNDWRAFYFLGIVNRQMGDIAGAQAAWLRVVALQPEYEQAHEQLRRLESH